MAQTNGCNGSAFHAANEHLDYEVIIIGAGLSGIYSLYKMRQLGLKALVLETGEAEGGTWMWNRYPGARFDSESFSYIFSFSEEVLNEWTWTERYAPQTETLKYIKYIVDKFDMRRDMRFNTQVKSAHFQQTSNSWLLTDQNGLEYSSRFLITAMGILSAPTLPNIPGLDNFKGDSYHTARWPASADIHGKKVGVIGTGASGIQTIQSIADKVEHLSVFQRTPNWTGPLRNTPISTEEMEEIRRNYPETFRQCLSSPMGFIYQGNKTSLFSMTQEERTAQWESLYALPGLAKVFNVSFDIYRNREANALYSKFHADKIRERVHDPQVAEKLIPKNHGFGTRRVPLETGYYEVFNQPNVTLVDVNEDPIEMVTEKGVQTANGFHELDVLICATGFESFTGGYTAIDFQGVNGRKLKDLWTDEIQTFLGITVHGYPNLFMVMGPQQAGGNAPRAIEPVVDWISHLVEFARDNDINYIEATEEKMAEWTRHAAQCTEGLLFNEVDSWFNGVNKNLAHRQRRMIMRYNRPGPEYRKMCEDVRRRRYSDFILKSLDV